MSHEIIDKIIKTATVEWKRVRDLQPPNLKECTRDQIESLALSIQNNGFISPLNVWENEDGELYFLDGHHRKKALYLLESRGVEVPGLLNANFIDCGTGPEARKNALKYILLFNSYYSKVTEQGLYELISTNELDLKEIESTVNLEGIKWDHFNENFLDMEPPAVSDKPINEFTFKLKFDTQDDLDRFEAWHSNMLDKYRDQDEITPGLAILAEVGA